MAKTFFLVIILIGFTITGYGMSVNNKQKIEESPWKIKTYDNFVKRAGTFPYTAPEEKKQRLLTNYHKLTLGMTKKQVAELFGNPDAEKAQYSKAPNNPGFIGWCWEYWIYKLESWGSNEKQDKRISIFYDTNGKVDWIVPTNIGGHYPIQN